MASIGLISPMIRHYRKIEALLGDDPDITVVYDAKEQEIKVYVDNDKKAAALERMLIPEIDFGSVTVNVIVVPSNKASARDFDNAEETLRAAFDGNPVVESIQVIEGIGSTPWTYVVFMKEVVQYYTDDLSDLYRVCSTLYEEIARDIFVMRAGVFYCTDVDECPLCCEVQE